MIKNLNDYKNEKFTKETEKEFNDIINKLTTSIELLKSYSKYIWIMESLSILHNSRTLFEIKANKLKEVLNEK